MDGGAWWAAVHGIAKSQTRLSDFTFTFHFHALEKEMATHSSVLALRIPGTAEPGGLPSMGLHRVGHNWSDLAYTLRHGNGYLEFLKFFMTIGCVSIKCGCLCFFWLLQKVENVMGDRNYNFKYVSKFSYKIIVKSIHWNSSYTINSREICFLKRCFESHLQYMG